MTPGGRLAAAIEILEEIFSRYRPANEAVRDWGRAHRFAGSADRAAIGNLVNAALRHRLSLSWIMGDDGPRALAIGTLAHVWCESAAAIEAMADGSRFAPAPLTRSEREGISAGGRLDTAPAHVAGDIPEWLAPSLSAIFGGRLAEQGRGLAGRAPLDIRVNTLKTTREKLMHRFSKLGAGPTRWSPIGLRFGLKEGPARLPSIENEDAHGRGQIEVQDEGSQIAALLAGAKPGMQVVDYCAGAGGKTLAMAATMENKGQIYAHDVDARRLRPIYERMRRAGARNIQIRQGSADGAALAGLEDRADLVVIDAPCTGSGIWRRRPDAKWRLRPDALASRLDEQSALLDEASRLVRPGGRLVYITCSVLPEENIGQVDSFLSRHLSFSGLPYRSEWAALLGGEPPPSADGSELSILLTPASHATDGFFVAIMRRAE